jgi:hypothetical protein
MYWSSWMNCNDVKESAHTIHPSRFTLPSERRCDSSLSRITKAGNIAWKLLSPR